MDKIPSVEEIRTAVAWAIPVNDYNFIDNKKAIKKLAELAELFISGKLIKPMGKGKIIKIITNNDKMFNKRDRDRMSIDCIEYIAQALVGKVGKK